MKTVVAALVLLVASALLVLGIVALLSVESVRGMLGAGLGLVGGGVLLVRLGGRLYLGLPSAFRVPPGVTEAETAAYTRDLAGRQGRAVAVFLVVMTVVYLLIGLFLVDGEAGVGAAAVTAVAAGLIGGLAWWQRRATGSAHP